MNFLLHPRTLEIIDLPDVISSSRHLLICNSDDNAVNLLDELINGLSSVEIGFCRLKEMAVWLVENVSDFQVEVGMFHDGETTFNVFMIAIEDEVSAIFFKLLWL